MIIPEDPTHDRYILKPIVSAILSDLGSRGQVQVLSNPRLRGFEPAVAAVPEILKRYPTYDLFLLLLDRDADEGRAERLTHVETQFTARGRSVIACLAKEEIETWLLGAQWPRCHELFPDWSWAEVRAERDVKERFFHPFFARVRNLRLPGEGREQLIRGGNLAGLIQRCPELATLRERMREALPGRP